MLYKIVGQNTKKVYARGSYRGDALRKLQNKYPYTKDNHSKRTLGVLFPEPLLIMCKK
ncbi:hypothetical protein [Oceanobacillus indicireducens]|uniref:Uncharacterized protein n=1 Tax=Oceanobacillus indicireducens TaxID=1004261 RepID=A0A917XVE0_9BACI|nr:hypothetical protein [Oceanobacillus indicireducens]GGN55013.1 hypothetical protein GCM10007971_13370 [Oceanobacillus indicireducens]